MLSKLQPWQDLYFDTILKLKEMIPQTPENIAKCGELGIDLNTINHEGYDKEFKQCMSFYHSLSSGGRELFDSILQEDANKFLKEQPMANTKRLKVFMDTEFTGLHKNTTLISIGLITEQGQTFYAELTDYDKSQIDEWLTNNVISNLYLQDKLKGHNNVDSIISYEDTDHITAIGTKEHIAQALRDWFAMITPAGEKVEIWSDCLAYDWVLFNDLFGHAFNIPEQVYYIPFDICTLFHNANIDPDISREKFMGVDFLGEHSRKHNALYDARVIKSCYKQLININELPFH